MASFARRRPPAAAWSVDDASTFTALKEFKLHVLQLLSTDAKAFTTARRLGIFSSKQQQPQKTARSGATDAATSARRTSDVASGHSAAPNSRRKRSAARSARHHAQIQVQLYRTAIAVIYFCRLRRKCRAQRLHAHLADLESLEAQSVRSDPGDAPLCFSMQCALGDVGLEASLPPSIICLLVCVPVRLLKQCCTACGLLPGPAPAVAEPAQRSEAAEA